MTMMMTSMMTSEAKAAKVAQLTMIVVISVPKLLTKMFQTWGLKSGCCWKCCSKNEAQWKPNITLRRERMAAIREPIAAQWESMAAKGEPIAAQRERTAAKWE
jgi:hypothetical protein